MFSCDNKNDHNKPSIITQTSKEIRKDTFPLVIKTQESEFPKCDCKQEKYKNLHNFDLVLHKNHWEKDKSMFNKSNIDSLIKNIKVIKLIQFDTIPKELSILKNINAIKIITRKGINGLDIFPNLEIVQFWGSALKVNKKEKWVSQIKYLRLEKTIIKELDSINAFKNLRQIDLYFSGFSEGVLNINSLSCLNKIHINAYRGLAFNLDEIDLKKMLCLKYLYILDVNKTTLGMPQNLSESSLDYIYLNNLKMTKEDRNNIKKYKESR